MDGARSQVRERQTVRQ